MLTKKIMQRKFQCFFWTLQVVLIFAKIFFEIYQFCCFLVDQCKYVIFFKSEKKLKERKNKKEGKQFLLKLGFGKFGLEKQFLLSKTLLIQKIFIKKSFRRNAQTTFDMSIEGLP